MQMLLNNGVIIEDAPIISDKTREYLSQFWRFLIRKEVEKEKNKYYMLEEKACCFNEPDNNTNEIEM